MTQPKTTRIPAPLYAAAGAGELAYQKLRHLPAVVTDLTGKVATTAAQTTAELRGKAADLRSVNLSAEELRGKAATTTTELREKATATLRAANATAVNLRSRAADLDFERLRGLALRNVTAVVSGANAAQERAAAVYGELVAHGERVVGGGVVQAADTVNADIEATRAAAIEAPGR